MDEEFIAVPRKWDASSVGNFMVWIGPTSSIFDFTTYVIHMIRTPKLPFLQSRASTPLTLLTLTGIAVLTVIPFTPLGAALGFASLPLTYFAYLIPCILFYMALATSLKKAYVRHYGELL